MKAIQTKYLGPTNYKGSRIKAWADGWGSATVSYDHGHPMPELLAVQALFDKVNADRHPSEPFTVEQLTYGVLPNGDYVFTFADSTIPDHEAWRVA